VLDIIDVQAGIGRINRNGAPSGTLCKGGLPPRGSLRRAGSGSRPPPSREAHMKTSRMELMELLADAWLRAAEAELREQAKDVFIEELLRARNQPVSLLAKGAADAEALMALRSQFFDNEH
jgi:hypothetical protein